MSSPKKVLVINCGANHVAVGFFTVGPKGPLLTAFETETIGRDYSNDSEWADAVAMGLRAISKRRKLSGPAYLIAPGHLLLLKFLKIPHVAKGKRDQIIRFEAQQNIPYPLPEVVWDYETVRDDGTEFEVALVAMKEEIIQGVCDRLEKIGIEAQLVEPSSIAEYNAFTHAYPEIKDGGLLISVGARSSDLLFSDSHGFFVRNIPIAGNTLTQAIADDLKLSFAEAEDLKIHVFAGNVDGIADEYLQGVQRATESFLRRFSMEVTRSIVNFRRQSGSEKVDSVFLTGGGAIVPEIIEYLSDKLKANVEWYDVLRNVSVGPRVSQELLDQHSLQLNSLVGGALRARPSGLVQFNLLPETLQRQLEFKRKRVYLVAAVATLVVAGIIPAIIYETRAETFETQAEELEAELQPLRQLDQQITQNLNRAKAISDRIDSLQSLVTARGSWILFLSDLQERLQQVEDVWIDRLQIVGEQQEQQPRQRSGGGLFQGAAPAPSGPSAGADSGIRLSLSGRMLDRANPTDRVSPQTQLRVNELLKSFAESEYVSAVEGERFNTDDPGILQFEFVLVLDPSHSL
ncbi:MAG TPA: pilus assembly protein PilM [Opitutales bacterium]|nr:pilus assembly protein PilM [Opitutales bacterium]